MSHACIEWVTSSGIKQQVTVPMEWVDEERKTYYWPKYSSNAKKLFIMKAPPQQGWRSFAISKILFTGMWTFTFS